jgi:uncharacterized protein
VLDTLDAAAVRRWCGAGLAALRAHQREIDDLNVYPVPDGDTGTNLVLTLASAHQAIELPDSVPPDQIQPDQAQPDSTPRDLPLPDPAERKQALPDSALRDLALFDPAAGPDPGAVWGDGSVVHPDEDSRGDSGRAAALGQVMRRMARGALLGARGNSGVIVSQIFRGMADAFSTAVAVRGGELAKALRIASEAAYAAVARPVEGTVLSVAAAAAEGAGRIRSDDLLSVARAAARSAAEALSRTPEQLPALARAGVVDAGGRGLVVLLEALVEALSTPETPPPPPPAGAQPPPPPAPSPRAGAQARRRPASRRPASRRRAGAQEHRSPAFKARARPRPTLPGRARPRPALQA